MRESIIHIITYALLSIVGIIINHYLKGHTMSVVIIFLLGYITFPLIKYLKNEN